MTEKSNNYRILLVEDNIINQEVANDMLEMLGYSVDISNNGKNALEMTIENHYDMILMDCQMPIMDGYEATKKIRDIEKTTQHRHYIIALTGNALRSDREKCLNAGMDDFLSKPFSFKQLNGVLNNYKKISA